MVKSEKWSTDKLKLWDKNPRNINTKDFERLKRQMQKFGVYKPLIVTPDGIVLGGNMRLRALQSLDIKEAWVSIVEPKSEQEMIEISLSDNDRAGYYDEKLLAELVYQYKDDIKIDDFSIDLEEPMNLKDFSVEQFETSNEHEQPRLDEKKKVKCPECGCEFEI